MTSYTKALQHAWDDKTLKPVLYSNRALAYLRDGHPELAAEDARQAILLKPDWGKAYYRLGSALLAQQMPWEAYDVFLLGVENAPRSAALKRMARRLRHYNRWQRADPTDPLTEKWRFHMVSLPRNPELYIANITNEKWREIWTNALKKKIDPKEETLVLHLGSGNGYLPLLEYRLGAQFVVDYERWEMVAEYVRKVK